jgi:hypothetical protein
MVTRSERRARRERARAKARRVLCYHRYGYKRQADVPDADVVRYADNLSKDKVPYWRELMDRQAAAARAKLSAADRADEEAAE